MPLSVIPWKVSWALYSGFPLILLLGIPSEIQLRISSIAFFLFFLLHLFGIIHVLAVLARTAPILFLKLFSVSIFFFQIFFKNSSRNFYKSLRHFFGDKVLEEIYSRILPAFRVKVSWQICLKVCFSKYSVFSRNSLTYFIKKSSNFSFTLFRYFLHFIKKFLW